MDEDATQEDCFRSADDILHNACAGIAEIINVEGNVNVDFEDVKTIMGEQGQAMMGTATASGADRARVAAAQAIACPLLAEIGRAHVCTPATNAHLVCSLLLEQKK